MIIANNLAVGGTRGTNLGGGGGGIQIQGVPATLTHDTFAYNQLGSNLVAGQAVLVLANGSTAGSANVNYNLIANHTVGQSGASAVLVQQNNTLTFTGGMFAQNTLDTNNGGAPMPKGTINGLSSVKSFSTAGFVSHSSNDYHILSSSPAVDQVTTFLTNIDIDCQGRPYNNLSDYDADEYWPNITAHPSGPVLIFLPLILKQTAAPAGGC